MPTIYQTREGDVLDAICASHYGHDNLSAALVSVLEANQGLADRGAVYTAGLIISLPDLPTPVKESSFNLWD